MPPRFPEVDEFRQLLDALCEESLEQPQMQRLEHLMLTRPEAEAYYVQFMAMYAELAQELAPGARAVEQTIYKQLGIGGPDSHSTAAGSQRFRASSDTSPRRWLWRCAGLALLLLAAIGFRLAAPALFQAIPEAPKPGTTRFLADAAPDEPLDSDGRAETIVEPTDDTIAVIQQAHGAVWESTGIPTATGVPLPPGRLALKAGLVQIVFYSGATVILEGPAELELISAMQAYCARGKLRANVPPHAHGFTIGSPRMDLVDLGTEFGLKVDDNEVAEVHVFDGKVELHNVLAARQSGPEHELTTGQAVRLNGQAAAEPIDTNAAEFVNVEDLVVRAEAEARRLHRNWLNFSETIRRDPSLVLYYTFQTDDTWTRTLVNQAAGGAPAHDGTIVGCRWESGRWPGKQALEFKQVSDRVRLTVPGEFDDLTLAAWVRVDALPNRFNSLFMTDSWDEAEGHWHITPDGTLELGIQGPGRKSRIHYYAKRKFDVNRRLGQWIHLAVVYDRTAQLVRHYVDGAIVMQDEIVTDSRLRIGGAELGNWDVLTRRHNHPIRFFSGRIDEFMIFSRALAPEELADVYVQGRPG